MAQLGFDASQVAPDTGVLDPLPPGWYNVIVDESELKPTADGLGARLAVRFNVIDGQFANRKIYSGFNIRNANPVAQEIAFKQLSALAHAVNVLQVQDSAQLHNIPLKVRVKVKPPKDGYDASNDITAYKNFNEQVGGPTAGAAAGVPSAPSAPSIPTIPATPAAPTIPATPAAPGAPAFTGTAQPWAQPGATAAPAAPATPAPPPFTPPAPAAPETFPPAGWTAHPTAAGFYYMGQEVVSEADLRARMAANVPAAPTIPAAPAVPAAPATPDPAAVAGVATPPWQTPKA